MQDSRLVLKDVAFTGVTSMGVNKEAYHTIQLLIDELTQTAYLTVDGKRFEMNEVRKSKGHGAGGESTENVRVLHGSYRDKNPVSRFIIVVDCGATPPEFKFIVENTGSHLSRESVYYIDHSIQNKINNLIDSSQIKSESFSSQYVELLQAQD